MARVAEAMAGTSRLVKAEKRGESELEAFGWVEAEVTRTARGMRMRAAETCIVAADGVDMLMSYDGFLALIDIFCGDVCECI